MADRQDTAIVSLNARAGALALAVGAPLNLVLHMEGPRLGPLSFAAWLAVSFGMLCFCEEMGAAKPLNRAGLVIFAAAFCADAATILAVDPAVVARARLLYAFAVLGALVFWSIALMHRRKAARAAGMVGAAVSAGAIVLLVAAHILLGTVAIFGFSQLFSALSDPGNATFATLSLIDAVLFVWCLVVSIMLWTARLRGGGE